MSRWVKRLGIGLGVVVVLLVGLRIVIAIRDQTDPVDPDAIAEDFDDSGATTDGVPALDTGVWAYDASGEEYIDVLGGPLHEFPEEVAQTVSDTMCGQAIDLRLFEQRYDILDLCRDDEGRLLLDTIVTHHEFVGIVDETVTDGCDPLAVWWPGMEDDVDDGPTSASCTATSTVSGEVGTVLTHEILGVEQIVIAGEEHRAVRIRLTSELGTPRAPTQGTYVNEFWFGLDDPTILRRSLDAEASAESPFGSLGYEEQFDLWVQSIEPLPG